MIDSSIVVSCSAYMDKTGAHRKRLQALDLEAPGALDVLRLRWSLQNLTSISAYQGSGSTTSWRCTMETTISLMIDQYEQGNLTRRQLVSTLAVAMGLGATGRGEGTGDKREPTFKATRLNHIALSVTDVARSRDFYVDHLGLSVSSDSSPHNCFLDCGPNFVALFRGQKAGMHHYCYSIADFDQLDAAKRLRAENIDPDLQGGRIYFRDPDELTVQLASETHGS
jgi:catechol 2,3-dioxygenase-like lactoylglutathione lyase family enzyme